MDFNREMPRVITKMPLILKILIAGVPILIAVLYSFYSTSNDIKNKKQFYKQEISSLVIKSDISDGRVTEFYLENGLKIYFGLLVNNTIAVGDSIKKDSNTYIYDVYRKKENGKYKFWSTYDFERVY